MSKMSYQLRMEIADHLVMIDKICKNYGLDKYKFTLLGRIPREPNSFLMFSNDSNDIQDLIEKAHMKTAVPEKVAT